MDRNYKLFKSLLSLLLCLHCTLLSRLLWFYHLFDGRYTIAVPVQRASLYGFFGVLFISLGLFSALVPSPLLLAATGVVFLCTFGVLLQPRFALLLTFTCASFPAFIIPLPGYNMHLIEPAVLLCGFVVIVHRPSLHVTLHHLFALVFLAIAFISFLHVPEFVANAGYASIKRLLALLIVIVAFFCGTFLVTYLRDIPAFLVSVLLIHVPLYLVGLAEAANIHLPTLLEAVDASNSKITQGRLWGPFPWSVNFAMYLINLFAISLSCFLCARRKWVRVVGLVVTAIIAVEIIGSGTRSVVLAALLIFIVACIFTRHLKTLALLLALLSLPAALLFTRFLPLFVHDQTSIENRLFIWSLALQLIHSHFWLGIGLQQFPHYYAQFIVSRTSELGRQGIHPHEQYLEWAMESGIFWLLTGVLLLLSLLFTAWRTCTTVRYEQRTIWLAMVLAVVANTLVGFFDAPLDQLEGAVCFFLLSGLALGTLAADDPRTRMRLLSQTRPIRATFLPAVVSPARALSSSVLENRKTFVSVVWLVLSWALGTLLMLPVTLLLAHYLGPVQYGEYSLTFPFLTFFALCSGAGMDALLLRRLSCQPRSVWRHLLSYAAGSRLLSVLFCVIFAILLAYLLPVQAEQRNLFVLGSVSLLFSFSFNGLRTIYSLAFRVEQKVKLLATIELANRVLTAVLILLIILWHLSLLWAYLLLIYSDLPAFFFQVFCASRRFHIHIRLRMTDFCAHMFEGFLLTLHKLLLLLLSQADIFLLLLLVGPVAVGFYALASRLIDPLISLAHAYVNGLSAPLCQHFSAGTQAFALFYHSSMRILMLVTIPLIVFIDIVASPLVNWLGGPAFTASMLVVPFLVWAMVATFLNQLNEQACIAANLERSIPLVTLISVCCNILANLILIPHWFLVGAGLAALIGEYTGLGVYLYLLRRYVYVPGLLRLFLLICLNNLPAIILLYCLRDVTVLLVIPLSVLLTFVCYLTTRILTRQDLVFVQRMLFHRAVMPPPSSDIYTLDC